MLAVTAESQSASFDRGEAATPAEREPVRRQRATMCLVPYATDEVEWRQDADESPRTS